MRVLRLAPWRLRRLRALLPAVLEAQRHAADDAFARRRPYWDVALPPARRLHVPDK
ncbi:MAG: hypothetical protein IBX62_00745 [Coriobacteriia bacterium]|nr:hypothetical protein [Coriobacteriia bacterium]